MDKPILSIAIPTYGAPKAVKQLVEDILAWDIRNIEIIVVDNDETGTQIKEYMLAIEDGRFVYFQNEKNIGRSNNIVKAVELSKANHVLVMSSDDRIFYDAVVQIIGCIRENPSIGLIMAQVKTTDGKNGFPCPKPGVYTAGAEALMRTPFLGNLVPMVVNKINLDVDGLYNQDEYYMQTRMSIIEACKADVVVLDCVLGEMIANEVYAENIEKFDVLLLNGYSPEKWDATIGGDKYYSPQARVKQLKQYLDLIDQNCVLRLNWKLEIVHKWVTNKLADALYAVIAYQSSFFISTDGNLGHLDYGMVIDYFEREMLMYFAQKEYEKKYYFVGRLRDIIKNEMILINQGKEILNHILCAKHIGIYGYGRQVQLMKKLLECMDVLAEIFVEGKGCNYDLILVPDMYSYETEKILKSSQNVYIDFMDRMGKYIGINWCSEHSGKEYWRSYNAYID